MKATPKKWGFNRFFLFGALLLTLSGNAAAGEDTRIMVPSLDVYGPRLPIRRIAGPQWAAGMELRGNLLYVLGSHALWIYDVTNPISPRQIGKLDGLFNGRQIALSGSTACIAARANGLYLVDISDPRHPRQLSRFDTIELATGVAAAGPVAFVSLRVYGIECVDISDPARPRHLSLTKTPEAQSSWYDAGKLYVGNWAPCSMSILDLANPRNPKLLYNHPLSGYGDGLMVVGPLGLASTGHHARTGPQEQRKNNGHGLDLIDLANPLQPKTLSHFHFPPYFSRGNDFWTVRLSGDTAIAADSHNGVFLVNISDRRNPKGVAHLRLPEVRRTAGGGGAAAEHLLAGDRAGVCGSAQRDPAPLPLRSAALRPAAGVSADSSDNAARRRGDGTARRNGQGAFRQELPPRYRLFPEAVPSPAPDPAGGAAASRIGTDRQGGGGRAGVLQRILLLPFLQKAYGSLSHAVPPPEPV